MGFAQEMKDFVSAAEKGWKMMTPTNAEVNAAALREAKRQAAVKEAKMNEPISKGGAGAIEQGDQSGLTPIEGEPAQVREEFIKNVSEGDEEGRKVTNPVALDALRAYGQRESGWDPMKVVGRWSDTSETGGKGTSGGALSWRNERHDKMLDFMKRQGGSPVAAQAKFFLQEDPHLVEQLEKAKTPEEANRLMANAWRFAGYKNSGGEFGRRLALTRSYSSRRAAPEPAVALPVSDVPLPPRRPDGMTTSAVDLGPGVGAMPLPTQAVAYQPSDEEDYLQPTVYGARGGLVPTRHYAEGGAVDLEDDANDDVQPSRSAGADLAAIKRLGDDPLAYIQYAAGKGLDQIQNRFGLKRGAVPEESPRAQDGARALAANAGAPNPNDVEEMMRAADPEGKLSADQRAMNGWSNLIRYHAAHDNPQGVANAGAAMLMHSKRISQQAGAMALTALERGDFNTAAKAIQAAYNSFPDGESVRVNAAGESGVEYEVVTPKGIRGGKATPEELKELATGMLNGTQWFQHAAQLTQGAKPADLAKQRRAKARSDFEETEMDEKGFIGTLSEEGKKKFARMDPTDKKEFMGRHLRESENAAKQERFDTRNQLLAERDEIRAGRMQEREARKEDMSLFKEAVKQKRWDVTRDQVMTNFERMAALRERDLSDRNTRHKESLDARQKRYTDIDRGIMERTRGIGEKESAKERIERRRLEGEQTAEERLTGAVEAQTPLEATGASEGAMQARRERTVQGVVEPIRAGGAYARIPPAERKVDEEDFADMRKIIDDSPAWKAAKLEEPHKLWAARIASDIHATGGGKLRKEDAVNMVQSAVNPKNPEPRVQPDGSVKIVPNLPSVNLTTESMIQLNNLRNAAAQTLRQGEASRFPSATRATLGPAVPGAVDLEQQRAEIAARRAAESRGGSAIDLSRVRDTLMPPVNREEAVRQALELQRRDEERRRRQRAIGNIR